MITRLTGIRRRAFGIGLSSYHDVAQLIRHHDHLAGRPSLEELLHLGILQHTALYLFTGEIPRQNELALDLAIELHHQLDLVRAAGVGASRERQETEQEIVLTIRIPKSKAPLSRSR